MKENREAKKPMNLEQELQALENRLVRMIRDRARLLKKSALARKSKNLSLVDSGLEKRLWQDVWRESIQESGLDQRRCRSVFQILNSLGTDLVESPEDRPFALSQRGAEVNIDIQGPTDTLMTRMWLALGAGAGADLQLDHVVMNDPLYELAKALNQAGSQVAWAQDRVTIQGGSRLEFDRKVIFSGQDSLNTHLLIVLAALQPGVSKVTGGSSQRLVNLKAVQDVLPQLGARATPLVPGSQGLPLRIEASGSINDTIHIPVDAPWELGAALILLAPLMKVVGGVLDIQCPSGHTWAWKLKRVLHILAECSVQTSQHGDVIQVGGLLEPMPDHPALPCDPALNGYVHGFAAMAGGKVATRGEWPEWLGETEVMETICGLVGLEMSSTGVGVESAKSAGTAARIAQDLTGLPEFAPLVLALGLASGAELVLDLEPEGDLPFAVDLLDSLQVAYELTGGKLVLGQGDRWNGRHVEVSFQVPTAWWGLGLALVSMIRPNMTLKNPGELTSLWPQFWTLYRGLPEPTMERKQEPDRENAADHGSRKRRRIVD